MDFVLNGINEVYQGGAVCDLFSGSASLAGAIGQQCLVHSNDIQNYSAILSRTYNQAYFESSTPSSNDLIEQASKIVAKNKKSLGLNIIYSKSLTLDEFNQLEEVQKNLINRTFRREWHLFVKNYSGTWWSSEQCLWIDALREVADQYKNRSFYPVILSSLMFGMAYSSQGTGHYAQYRDAKTESSLSDILIYRKRSLVNYFIRKYDETLSGLSSNPPKFEHKATAMDFKACLTDFQGGVVYADPPYCFVHYSRFYHAIETLVLYDYPTLQIQKGHIVKGRYRDLRHQSPFCIKTKVKGAFVDLFNGVKNSNSNLAMSYSNTGMISIEEIEQLATNIFKNKKIELLTTDHKHMTLGRKNDRHREVKECLILVS
jgi:adenine-specific DNA-methyltransferase